ncbi:hypothetical protein Tsp_10747 [Trichinella spiralis]|uniref:hypothetical protein n=1 Tax=Trichinella spiralis TaxID=6334 RepID=UPI0001EFD306|nr:hypothetical protein Tsp_10747 [Trichinella spiralis]
MLANFSTTADVLCRIPSVKPGSIFLFLSNFPSQLISSEIRVVASTFETFYKPIVRFLTSLPQLAQHCHRKIIYLPNVKSSRHENERTFLKFGSIQIIFFANSDTAISLLPPDGCKTRTTICSGTGEACAPVSSHYCPFVHFCVNNTPKMLNETILTKD